MRPAQNIFNLEEFPMRMNRRSFLGRSAVGLIGLGTVGCAWHEVNALVPGVAVPFVTPNGRHYVKNGAEGSLSGWREPKLSADAWSLSVGGLVDREVSWTYADLQARSADAVEVLKTMQCVVDANSAEGLVSTAMWRGVPLRILLEEAGIDLARARRIRFYGADGFTNNLPVERIFDPTQHEGVAPPLLVTHMNGLPLTREHGAPVRLIVPDGFGYAAVKWLERIEVTEDDSIFGTYQDTGFTDESRSPVMSRFTAPVDNLQVASGLAVAHGYAVWGHAGIERVEVRIDGGEWFPARMASANEVLASFPEAAASLQFQDGMQWPFRGVWALWSFEFQATPGKHTLEARSFDRLGNVQPERDLEISDGINSYASVRLRAA